MEIFPHISFKLDGDIMTWGILLVIMFVITILSYIRIVWVTKGHIGLFEENQESIQSVCHFKVTIDLGPYAFEEKNEISKWLRTHCKNRYWGQQIPRQEDKFEKIAMYFENKDDAMRFKNQWQ
jgi:hypothetical protein